MKLYVCWGTFGGDGHPCAKAHNALKSAGYEPEVKKARGWAALPAALNPGRKEVIALTGEKTVPVLVTDDGEAIRESDQIVAWAESHPAGAASSA